MNMLFIPLHKGNKCAPLRNRWGGRVISNDVKHCHRYEQQTARGLNVMVASRVVKIYGGPRGAKTRQY